jgi:glycosyltransferase involved in cell wall biosynthesis
MTGRSPTVSVRQRSADERRGGPATAHRSPSVTRVLHLLPDLAIGGGQAVVLDLVRHLDRSRYSVDVAYLGDDRSLEGQMRDAGARTFALRHHPGRAPRTLLALRRLLIDERIAVLHVHSDLDRRLGQVAALTTRTPVVGHLHSEWVHLGSTASPDAPLRRRARARLGAKVRGSIEHRTVRCYLAVSREVAERFEPRVRAPIELVAQPIDTTRFGRPGADEGVRARLGLQGDVPLLIDVARLAEGKGQEDLLHVVAALLGEFDDTVLLLVGDGPNRGALTQAVEQAGLTDHVRLLGPRTDVPALLAAADVFVFPSASEGLPIALLEAMAAGLPVVAYGLPSLRDLHDRGAPLQLVDRSPTEMSRAIGQLLHDPEQRAQIGRRSRDFVVQRFEATTATRRVEAIYARVGAPRSAGR